MIGRKYIKFIAVFLAVNFLVQTLGLTITYALTSGPSQPEFSSFEPVATTNMVNPFTGDFTYNLPLLEVPGPHGSSYPISLSYHSGVSAEEEASWIGYGWTLNAGAINRSTRGFPDDFKNETVNYYNKTPKNWTVTVGGGGSTELFSSDNWASISASAALRYNNYKGFGKNIDVGLHLGRGIVSMGYGVSDGEGSFSLSVQPMKLLQQPAEKSAKKKKDMTSEEKIEHYKKNFSNTSLGNAPGVSLVGSNYGLFSMSEIERPTHIPEYKGGAFNISANAQFNPSQLPAGVTANVFGSYSYQENIQMTEVDALGYMYSSENKDSNYPDQLMDYSVEKENSFNKRDVFLGVPFNNADQFMVTAEGLSGGFRMYHKQLGYFGPRHMGSDMKIVNLSPELDAGLNFGGGLDIGVGKQKMAVSDWDLSKKFSRPEAEEDEPVFFRFNGDLGGSWGDNHDDNPVRALPSKSKVTMPKTFNFDLSNGQRSGRSSYIGYNTVANTNAVASEKYYKAYSKRGDIRDLRSSELKPHQIGEIAVYNESGVRYVYGLPVLNRNEANLSYGVSGASAGDVKNNYIVYHKDNKTLLGTFQKAAYASSYLLTEITTSDYIDRSYNGPTPDDFGGYTRFNYSKVYGDSNEMSSWYTWRNPYRGLRYSRGSLSDKKDDIGTVSGGEKELVYLQSIETKSHVAIFYTKERDDAMSAGAYNDVGDQAKGTAKQSRLTKIELYPIAGFKLPNGQIDRAKVEDPDGLTPIKTIHFEYYGYEINTEDELQTGAPNVDRSEVNTRGRLTLARVYFEYNGLTEGRISPYVFKYKYPGDNTYPAKYDDLDNYLGAVVATDPENPPYSAVNSDAWGNYQPNGQDQYDKMRPWLNQKLRPNVDFDPAAWNLKVIQLPSKGEIHIQYEQDDYSYVQDQEAHVMAPLVDGSTDNVMNFEIDHEQIGLASTDLENLKSQIERRYLNTEKRIYFKFLYRLKGTTKPELRDCDVDYIDGFAKVTRVVISGGKLFLTLGEGIPKNVCTDFVKRNRLGMLDRRSCDAAQGALNDNGDAESMVMQLLEFVGGSLVPNNICEEIEPELSYLRIPTPIAKQGGGLRVRRLLTYDNSLGKKELYGNEYIYKTVNEKGEVISSGVATNEPATISEENILRDFVKRKGQTKISALIAGKDMEQSEGPIGESALPGASVGYSKVFTKNIHSGKTAPGYSLTEYYTAKDYPVKVDMTSIDNSLHDNKIKMAVLMNEFLNYQYVTQGFSIIKNQMHGQLKRMATYSGDFPGAAEAETSPLITEQLNDYFAPGEDIPVLNELYGEIVPKNLGREVDITMAQKMVTESSSDLNVEADFTVGVFFLFVVPFLTAMPSSTVSESLLATHVTTKVVQYPAILRKTTSYQDGIYHTTENVAFNEHTGQAVAVRSYDEFNGSYLSQQVPASWEYKNFEPLSTSEGRLVTGTFEFAGNHLKVNDVCLLQDFNPGDLLEIGDNSGALYHVHKVDYVTSGLELLPVGIRGSDAPSSASTIRVLRSGRNNQLSASVGNITIHDVEQAGLPNRVETVRYRSVQLTRDLNQALNGLSGSGDFTLTGPYSNVDISGFTDIITCTTDLTQAEIQNVDFLYTIHDEVISLQLMAFDLISSDCTSGIEIIKAEGWK